MAEILSTASMKLHADFTRTIFAASEQLVRKWRLLEIGACRSVRKGDADGRKFRMKVEEGF